MSVTISSFQFHLVRLKGTLLRYPHGGLSVSIPFSTIKSVKFAQPIMTGNLGFNSI